MIWSFGLWWDVCFGVGLFWCLAIWVVWGCWSLEEGLWCPISAWVCWFLEAFFFLKLDSSVPHETCLNFVVRFFWECFSWIGFFWSFVLSRFLCLHKHSRLVFLEKIGGWIGLSLFLFNAYSQAFRTWFSLKSLAHIYLFATSCDKSSKLIFESFFDACLGCFFELGTDGFLWVCWDKNAELCFPEFLCLLMLYGVWQFLRV